MMRFQFGRRLDVRPYICSTTSIAVAFYFFLLAVDLMTRFIRLSKGVPAVATLFGIVVLGIGVLTVIIVFVEYYRRLHERGKLLPRFLLITAIEGFLFPVLEVLRLLVYLPVARVNDISPLFAWNVRSWILFVGGAVLGTGLTIAASVLAARGESAKG